ncbi:MULTISPECIES: TIGR03086 family metal-binding protein [Streptomyces]|uniref:TIGR03086 family metal-binding protein n=1 Tax=Streptomyces TaxID=1883 RepID=UPI00167A94EE|nr:MULTISPECIES: TIGR03086 family metal-binding protein [Streptomyces]WGP13525.1 TIGR03086 family metal-binding protein [Streptomyces sp. SH5]GGP46563.1 TIGR03086 family protein [Streptomyces sindenensis]
MDTHETSASAAHRTAVPAAELPDLEPAARRIAELLAPVDDGALDGPTPCPDYTVRELLGHLIGLATAFRDAARKDLGPSTATSPDAALPVLDDDWREVLPRRLEEVAAAWRSPDAWTGMTRAGGIELPGEVAGAVALDELVIHGWDLARSTGQPYAAGEAELRSCEALLAPDEDDPDRGGIFGPPVPVPADAPLLDRVIALSGRRPNWRPGG